MKMKRRKMIHMIPNYSFPRDGPGEEGKSVDLSPREAALGREQMKLWFMNVIARFLFIFFSPTILKLFLFYYILFFSLYISLYFAILN